MLQLLSCEICGDTETLEISLFFAINAGHEAVKGSGHFNRGCQGGGFLTGLIKLLPLFSGVTAISSELFIG